MLPDDFPPPDLLPADFPPEDLLLEDLLPDDLLPPDDLPDDLLAEDLLLEDLLLEDLLLEVFPLEDLLPPPLDFLAADLPLLAPDLEAVVFLAAVFVAVDFPADLPADLPLLDFPAEAVLPLEADLLPVEVFFAAEEAVAFLAGADFLAAPPAALDLSESFDFADAIFFLLF